MNADSATDPSAIESIKAQFARVFGDRPAAAAVTRGPAATARVHVLRAPGRVNLIGEHTDYNEGFVFPMAIEPEVRLACRARDDGRVRLASTAFPGQIVEFSVQQKIAPGEPAWANYCKG